ncbi:hypothetical protein CDL15_Pgr026947 [Punica granatum]|uniref:Uncharacterized protein n=1 Tax=Punica granatum TaxID=22663 RepID=A0A218XYI8_PUNGR|nr:hypothetical protein CDL15_Pgr026947 [Punica granatum]
MLGSAPVTTYGRLGRRKSSVVDQGPSGGIWRPSSTWFTTLPGHRAWEERGMSETTSAYYPQLRKLDERLLDRLKCSALAENVVLAQAEVKQLTDPTIRKCLDELRDAVYDAENMLDEIAARVLKSKLKAQHKKSIFKLRTLLAVDSKSPFHYDLSDEVLDHLVPSLRWRLINLRHLDTRGTPLRSALRGIGKLKDLQTLTDFILAKEGGSRIKELGGLCDLKGLLSLGGLENVLKVGDAKASNLECKSPRFPHLLTFDAFINISVLNIEDCKHCTSLPTLGQLTSLQKLLIKGLDVVVIVGPKLNGKHSEVFQSLEYLEFDDMKRLQKWVSFEGLREGEAFPRLQKLITKCPVLRRGLPGSLPLLTELAIEGCPLLEAALPRLPLLCELHLKCSDRVSEPVAGFLSMNSIQLQLVSISENSSLPVRCFPPSMTTLIVKNVRQLDLRWTCATNTFKYVP